MSELDERLDEARRALGTMGPSADLWARAMEHSGRRDAALHELTNARRAPRPTRVLAAAAVAAVFVLIGAVVLRPDERSVETVPGTDDDQATESVPSPRGPVAPTPGTIVSGHGCPFGIAGDPIVMEPGPVDPLGPRFDAEPGQNIAHTVIGSQVAEIRVPGFDLTQADRWRMEDIRLERGTAQIWLDGPPSGEQNKPFVQVRWFPDTQQPCASFTVTVDGGDEDANRRVAIDLANRIVLPDELGDPDLPGAEGGPVAGLELAGTVWTVADTSSGPSPGGRVSFDETTVTWDSGCATITADYQLDRDDGFLTFTNRRSTDPGCTPPTVPQSRAQPWEAVDAVMSSERIPVAFILDRPSGAAVTVTGLLRLGEHPDGSYLLLASA